MTKKEFKEAMKRGLGRCIQELDRTDDIEKYRDIVMWGCKHNISFDTQSEGARAWYLHELVKRFPDETPFVSEVINRFSENKSNGGWQFTHYCDLLASFAADGNKDAVNALKHKYNVLYDILKKHKKLPASGIFPARDDFEYLCIALVDCAENSIKMYLRIAEEIGELYRKSKLYDGGDFIWLYNCCSQNYGKSRVRKTLEAKAKKSDGISRYLAEYDKYNAEIKLRYESRKIHEIQTSEEFCAALNDENALTIGDIIRFAQNGSSQEIMKLAQAYVQESDVRKKIAMLNVFSRCDDGFPLSPRCLIADARSEDDGLSSAAVDTLEKTRDSAAHEFALELARDDSRKAEAIRLLCTNYQKSDKRLLAELVKSLPIDYNDKFGWHGAFMSVQELFEGSREKKLPKELLQYIYENALCSFCREYTLYEMGRRRMVTEELCKECLYDSNQDIRNYAAKRLKMIGENHDKGN